MVDTDDTRRTTVDGRRTTPRAWHKLPTGELKVYCIILFAGKVCGKRLLEIGSGPSPHSAIIPALFFDEIYLSDYVEGCRKIITDWRNQEKDCVDFSNVFDFIASLDDYMQVYVYILITKS